MKRVFLAFGLALIIGSASVAKTPREVLEPYKAYRTALANGEKQVAAEKAYEAWQSAEKLMGDTQTTGDLAANFAETRPTYLNEKVAWKRVMRAHKRSIDLAHLHSEVPGEIEIDRRLKHLAWEIPTLPRNAPGANTSKYSHKRLKSRIEEYGLQGTTFEAEAAGLRAYAAQITKNWNKVVSESEEAIRLYDARTDRIPSVYEYAVPIYLARAYAELDQPIEAALTYQALMDKLESIGQHDNEISSGAYGEWLELRDEVLNLETADPNAIKVVEYRVPRGREIELSPLIRMPPVFPRTFLRGSKSGWVFLEFSVDEEGYPENILVTDTSNESLNKSAIKAVEAWRYSPNIPANERQSIKTTLRYDLRNRLGKRLPFSKPMPDRD